MSAPVANPPNIPATKTGVLYDDKGNPSSTRLALIVWVFGVLLIWGIKTLKDPAFPLLEIPESIMYIFGILMGGKVGQKHFETK